MSDIPQNPARRKIEHYEGKVEAILKGQTPDGVWHEPGDIFDFDGPLGLWMRKVDDADDKPRRGRPSRATSDAAAPNEDQRKSYEDREVKHEV